MNGTDNKANLKQARFVFEFMEHRMGVEPMNTGFADQRVSHFATGAHLLPPKGRSMILHVTTT